MEHLSAAVSCKSCTSFMFEMVTLAEMAELKSIRTGDISLSSRILCDLISLCDRGGGVEQLVDCQADGGEDGEQSGLGEGRVGQLSLCSTAHRAGFFGRRERRCIIGSMSST